MVQALIYPLYPATDLFSLSPFDRRAMGKGSPKPGKSWVQREGKGGVRHARTLLTVVLGVGFSGLCFETTVFFGGVRAVNRCFVCEEGTSRIELG